MEFAIPFFDQFVRIPIQPLLHILSNNGKLPGHLEFRAACNQGQGPFDTELSVLSYCMAYMYMHHDALISVLDLPAHQKALTQDTPALVIDIGCGPGTAGIALCNYLELKHSCQRSIYYIGIDISKPMLSVAKQFMDAAVDENCSFFQSAREAISWLGDTDMSGFGQYIIIASYLCSQDSMSKDAATEMAALIKNIAEIMAHAENLFICTNIDTNRAYSKRNYFPVFAQECFKSGIVLPKTTGSIATRYIRKPMTSLKYSDLFRDRAREDAKVCYVAGQIEKGSVDATFPSG